MELPGWEVELEDRFPHTLATVRYAWTAKKRYLEHVAELKGYGPTVTQAYESLLEKYREFKNTGLR